MLSEIAIERNSTIVFPAQFLDSLRDLTTFLVRERATAPLEPEGTATHPNGRRGAEPQPTP